MTQITLSKSTYLKEAKKLANYERYLPSLDLKRQQLMLEKNKAQEELQSLQLKLDRVLTQTADELQMLANDEMDLGQLVVVENFELTEQNVLGVTLPILKSVQFSVREHGYLTQPHWVDLTIQRLQEAAELQLQCSLQEQRVSLLKKAARKATQRVNLVSKILIPEANQNMRKIAIFLSDNERAAVVRSKLAKKKKQVESVQDTNLP